MEEQAYKLTDTQLMLQQANARLLHFLETQLYETYRGVPILRPSNYELMQVLNGAFLAEFLEDDKNKFVQDQADAGQAPTVAPLVRQIEAEAEAQAIAELAETATQVVDPVPAPEGKA